jgi:hypothetical protein
MRVASAKYFVSENRGYFPMPKSSRVGLRRVMALQET